MKKTMGRTITAAAILILGIGAGGAPGGHLDDQCAQVALDKVKDRLK